MIIKDAESYVKLTEHMMMKEVNRYEEMQMKIKEQWRWRSERCDLKRDKWIKISKNRKIDKILKQNEKSNNNIKNVRNRK